MCTEDFFLLIKGRKDVTAAFKQQPHQIHNSMTCRSLPRYGLSRKELPLPVAKPIKDNLIEIEDDSRFLILAIEPIISLVSAGVQMFTKVA